MKRSLPLKLALWVAACALAGCGTILDVDFGAFGPADGGVDVLVGSTCKTCKDLGAECGVQPDGCGNTLDCGDKCPAGATCDGLHCACTPKSCLDLGVACGIVDDGCGHSLDCGACAASLTCVANQCTCVAQTCATLGSPQCGTYPSGCGADTFHCGAACPGAKPNCVNGVCTAIPCTPKTCAQAGNPCDAVSDGCGGTVGPCTTCTTPNACGGGGIAHQCGCTAKTCAQAGNPCDAVANGCGGNVGPCTTCSSPSTCGGGGTAHQCGCTKTGKCPSGANCGTVPDGCGGNISCGANCTAPNTCGGGGSANVCGCTSILGTCSNCCGGGTDNCGRACTGSTCCGGGGGGGGCFPAGMPVSMADGSTRPIERVHVGDSVLGLSADGRVVTETVSGVDAHGPEGSAEGILVINGTLRVTPDHPVYTTHGKKRAGALRLGDEIVRVVHAPGAPPTARGELVTSIAGEPGHVPVFTLRTASGDPFVVDFYVMLQKQ